MQKTMFHLISMFKSSMLLSLVAGKSLDTPDYQGDMLSIQNIDLKFITQHAFFAKNRQYIRAVKNVIFDLVK